MAPNYAYLAPRQVNETGHFHVLVTGVGGRSRINARLGLPEGPFPAGTEVLSSRDVGMLVHQPARRELGDLDHIAIVKSAANDREPVIAC
jgi:hypothetical protein